MAERPSPVETAAAARQRPAGRYARIASLIAADRCVMLDGATGSELIEIAGQRPEVEEHLWGVTALLDAPADVKALHRRYVDVGCDVISTNTWALPTAIRGAVPKTWDSSRSVHWMDAARRGVRLARAAAGEAGRADEVAVAFSINGDVDTPDGRETIRLLARAFDEDRPDLILLETMSVVQRSTYATVEALLATGLPVWLSFRRCRHGMCGVYGEHWGGPEGDAFGRAAGRFEEMGVGALAINCVPPDHVAGMISWLRDFTDLPLGVYPNLGYLSSAGWRNEPRIGGAEYAELALQWREEGAQIIGGCCGVGAEHIAAARAALGGTRPGHARPDGLRELDESAPRATNDREHWTDARERRWFPLAFPELGVDPGVAAPTQASFTIWKHLHREGIGAHQRCLDVGCGTGLLAVELARNGAAHVHAIDVSAAAVENTLTNASRAGVSDRVSATRADLYPWLPEERYDVVVASLDQVPVDPLDEVATHWPRDFWGRGQVDRLIDLLPHALEEDGVAYMVQLSSTGERETIDRLSALGFQCRMADFGLVDLHEIGHDHREQVLRVERHSDAYHLTLGGRDVLVAYLLEITARRAAG